MTRFIFGGEATHLAVTEDAGNANALKLDPGTTVALYDAPGGTLQNDFLIGSTLTTPATSIVVNSDGYVPPFKGPDGLVALYNADGMALLPRTVGSVIPTGGTTGQVLAKASNSDMALSWTTPTGATLADGDKGDITVSGSGTVWNIDAGAVGTTELATTEVTEFIEDAIAALFARSSHLGITFTYADNGSGQGTLSAVTSSGGLSLDNMPSGYVTRIPWNGVSWPSTRPSNRTDIYFECQGGTVGPSWIDDVPGDNHKKDV